MRRRVRRFAAIAVCLWTAALMGCGGAGQVIEIRYERPARQRVPDEIRRLAVTPFEAATPQARKWGPVTADKLYAVLDECNRKFKRYRLVDRMSLKKVLDEQKLGMLMSDPSSAPKVAKIAKVDALTYGRVTVSSRDDHMTRQVFDPFTQRMKTVPHVRRTATVNVTFRIVDMASKAVLALEAARSYDSEKSKKSAGKSIGRFIGVSGPDLSATDAAINDLITECVQEIVGAFSPHEEVVRVELEKGKSEHVKTGNTLAATGEYKEALDCYLSGIQAKPDDHGAIFNAGVMYEAMGNLAKAEECYDRAFRTDKQKASKYARARRRVRMGSKL